MELKDIIEIEWKAEEIKHQYNDQGPKLVVIKRFNQKEIHTKSKQHFLVIQGSFDPFTQSHQCLIQRSIEKLKEIYPNQRYSLFILFSLAHVEKIRNLEDQTLFGIRIKMLEEFILNETFDLPITIAISNVAKYIDLINAFNKEFKNSIQTIQFCMGTDVFKKIFDQKYYDKPLKSLLSSIFIAKYFVAGRETTYEEKDLLIFLRDNVQDKEHIINKIYYLEMPEKLRYVSSTENRQNLRDGDIQSTTLPQQIKDYLSKDNSYQKNLTTLTSEIIIQSLIRYSIGLSIPLKEFSANCVLFINSIINKKDLSNKIIEEYKQQKDITLLERWTQYLNQNL